AALYSVLLVIAALTLTPVFGPVIVNPLVGVRFFKKAVPLRLVMVSATVTLVTPTGELAVKDRAFEYWNWRVPSGYTLAIVGWAFTALPQSKAMAPTRLAKIVLEGFIFFMV